MLTLNFNSIEEAMKANMHSTKVSVGLQDMQPRIKHGFTNTMRTKAQPAYMREDNNKKYKSLSTEGLVYDTNLHVEKHDVRYLDESERFECS